MEGFPGVCKTRIWTLRDSPLKSVQILPKQSSCKGIPTERVCVQGSYKQQGSGQGRTMHARTKKTCKRRLRVCDSDEPRSNTCTLLHNQPPQLGGLKQHPLTTRPQFCSLCILCSGSRGEAPAYLELGVLFPVHQWNWHNSIPCCCRTEVPISFNLACSSHSTATHPSRPAERHLLLLISFKDSLG